MIELSVNSNKNDNIISLTTMMLGSFTLVLLGLVIGSINVILRLIEEVINYDVNEVIKPFKDTLNLIKTKKKIVRDFIKKH